MQRLEMRRTFISLGVGIVLFGGAYFTVSTLINKVQDTDHNTRLVRQVADLQEKLDASLKAQTSNRTSNVRTWCTAINNTRAYSRDRAARLNRIDPKRFKRYTLPDLPCDLLAAGTQASTTAK